MSGHFDSLDALRLPSGHVPSSVLPVCSNLDRVLLAFDPQPNLHSNLGSVSEPYFDAHVTKHSVASECTLIRAVAGTAHARLQSWAGATHERSTVRGCVALCQRGVQRFLGLWRKACLARIQVRLTALPDPLGRLDHPPIFCHDRFARTAAVCGHDALAAPTRRNGTFCLSFLE